jgi:Leucine-rich repeat (LRR) protein/predicted DNA-binding WGR domain protein
MLVRRLSKSRSRVLLVLGWMHKTDGLTPQRCDSEAQLGEEVAKLIRAGYAETPRSLSRRVFHEGKGRPNEKYWAIEVDGKRQFTHYGSLRDGVWLAFEGTQKKKDFPSATAALADYEKKTKKKRSEGMKEYRPRATESASEQAAPAAKAGKRRPSKKAAAKKKSASAKSVSASIHDDPKLEVGEGYIVSRHASLPDLLPLAKSGCRDLQLDRKLKRAPELHAFLDACKSLRGVDLHDPAALTPPPKKSKVRQLRISATSLKTLAFLTGFPELELLELAFRGVRGLETLDDLVHSKKLRRLRANQHGASSLKALGKLPRLAEYAASSTKNLRTLDGLQGCPKLAHVNANLAPIADLDALATSKALLGLKIRKAKVGTLEPIYGAKKLETLFAEMTPLRSIDGIARGLPALKLLWLHSTKIGDIRPLAGLRSLLELDISGLPIKDFSPLAELKSLQYVDLFETSFNDLDLLDALPNLVRVRLAKTKVKRNDSRVKRINKRIKANNRHAEGLVFAARSGLAALSDEQAAYVREWGRNEDEI